MLALAMRAGRTSLLAYLLLMNAPSGAQGKVIENSQLYGWSLFAYTNDATGRFNHCAASVPYRSGISLWFAIDRSYVVNGASKSQVASNARRQILHRIPD